MNYLIYLTVFIVFIFLIFEIIYRKRDSGTIIPLTSEREEWKIINKDNEKCSYKSSFYVFNESKKYECTMVKTNVDYKILFKKEYKNDIKLSIELLPEYEGVREDKYVPAYIMQPLSKMKYKIIVNFEGNLDTIKDIHAIVISFKYVVYDRKGYHSRIKDMIFVPNKEADNSKLNLLNEEGASIYPIKTHLLSDEDDLASVIKKYTSNFAKEGDIITIAESPVAITQGRFKLPQEVKVGWWAKRLCYFIPSVGSLSTPYGMQCAIDQVGLIRFLFAMFVGAFMKIFGKNGWLYIVAGIESELIDDLTGTIPPYDQYIVLGPKEPQKLVNYIKEKTNLDIAIVDANDLKRARVVASTIPNMENKIRNWMLNNPAGNSYEQTPIVLIRPSNF
ncbi:MAG: hypothetical protein KatS3mg068_2084 [Candidatus Sericytochromatia bacterium]|nr:MAG: hypothetical protein KatS3mg068_2084 [Candidatus Sericytochromatia bacterium]